jgi:predicted  nucleic acid-binding Zn-ribbon protein
MDVVSLKKHLGTLEERELEVMIRVESAEKDLQSANEKLSQVQARLKDQNIDLSKESDTLNKDLENLESERKAVIGNLEEQAIKVYDLLRHQKRGVAVTTLSDNSCEACGTTFTASQQQNARSNSQLFYCPTCGRIIYAG